MFTDISLDFDNMKKKKKKKKKAFDLNDVGEDIHLRAVRRRQKSLQKISSCCGKLKLSLPL